MYGEYDLGNRIAAAPKCGHFMRTPIEAFITYHFRVGTLYSKRNQTCLTHWYQTQYLGQLPFFPTGGTFDQKPL